VDVGDVLGIAPVRTGDAEEADDLVTTHERGTGVGLLQLHALGRGEPTDPVTMALDDGLSTAHRCQVARTTRAIDGDDAELLTLARGLWAELRHRSVLDRGGQVNQHGLALGRIIGGEVVALGDRGPMTGSVDDLGALPAPGGVGPDQRPFGGNQDRAAAVLTIGRAQRDDARVGSGLTAGRRLGHPTTRGQREGTDDGEELTYGQTSFLIENNSR